MQADLIFGCIHCNPTFAVLMAICGFSGVGEIRCPRLFRESFSIICHLLYKRSAIERTGELSGPSMPLVDIFLDNRKRPTMMRYSSFQEHP